MEAAARVLNLPELLEGILVALPTKDLLFAQKVCVFWKRTIEISICIRKALYFVPGDAHDVDADYNNDHSLVQWTKGAFALNPLLFGGRRSGSFSVSMMRDLEHVDWSCAQMFITQPPKRIRAKLVIKFLDNDGQEELASFKQTRGKTIPTGLLLHKFADDGP
ncbi:hypothetical protein LTR17_007549 [Elasticomyces elasticus]|nr:hypothetical protein LTR17_007549 [Elasticomyces elasticus]